MNKFFSVIVLLVGATAFAAESTECKNIVQEGEKNVSCENLSGIEKAKCLTKLNERKDAEKKSVE